MGSPRMKAMEKKIAIMEDKVGVLLVAVSLLLVDGHIPKDLRQVLSGSLEEILGVIRAMNPPPNGGRP